MFKSDAPGLMAIAKYKSVDEQSTNEGHPEDETTGGGGQMATIVDPNPKCNSCLHYNVNRSLCMMALVPTSCGDGSKPETGFAPLVPNATAYQEWRAKRGLQHNAPRGTVAADGLRSASGAKPPVAGPGESPDFEVQVLGDEGHMELSLSHPDLRKGGKLAAAGYQVHVVGSPKSGGVHLTHIPPGKKQGSFLGPKEGFPSVKHAVKFAKQHMAGAHKSMSEDSAEKCMKCGAPWGKGSSCMKCGTALKKPNAFDLKKQAARVGGPVSKGLSWSAITRTAKRSGGYGMPGHKYGGSATQRLTENIKKLKKQKASAVKTKVRKGWKLGDAGVMGGKPGSRIRAKPMSTPRTFVKPGGKPRTAAGKTWRKMATTLKTKVHKAATMPMPKLKNPAMKQGYAGEDVDQTKHMNIKPIDTHNPKRQAAGVAQAPKQDTSWAPGKTVVGAKVDTNRSPMLHAIRRRQMENPQPEAKYKAAQAGGGKVFSHAALAQHVGMKPEHIADLAHASQHVHDFHAKVRKEFGDKVKNLTSGQIRSAYHSTGLMHALTSADLTLIKSHKMKRRCCIGHTTSGKPIHSDAHGWEAYDEDDHRDASETHLGIAARMSSAVDGGAYGLSPAGKRYMRDLADHHRHLGSKHGRTADDSMNKRIRDRPAEIKQVEPFGKSVQLRNDPSDADIAKALASGGAGSLVEGGMVNAPVLYNVPAHLRGMQLDSRLPGTGTAVLLTEEVEKKEAPKPMVGGVLSSAWDLGQRY
jgi:hypothetical protein